MPIFVFYLDFHFPTFFLQYDRRAICPFTRFSALCRPPRSRILHVLVSFGTGNLNFLFVPDSTFCTLETASSSTAPPPQQSTNNASTTTTTTTQPPTTTHHQFPPPASACRRPRPSSPPLSRVARFRVLFFVAAAELTLPFSACLLSASFFGV